MAPDPRKHLYIAPCHSSTVPSSYRTMLLFVTGLWTLHMVRVSAQFPNSGSSSNRSRALYTRMDELPGNAFVGNVIRDANIHRHYDQDVLDTFVLEIIGGQFKDYFRMDTEVVGDLRTSRFLDRDSVCRNVPLCDLSLDIAVVRPPQYFQTIQVNLTLLDENDNSPEFSSASTTIYISENAHPPVSFVLPTASDPDTGIFGIQSYSFVHRSSKFELEKMDSGDGTQDIRLKLMNSLNREQQSSYTLQVQAKDGGRPAKTGLLDIQVIVADANDNTPKFQRSSYNVSIPENHPINSAFLQLQASDPDQGPNGQVRYSLAAQTIESYGDIFTIDSDSGEMSLLQELDYETQNNFHLLITAQDQGPDSVPVHARVVVQVLDVNDFVPQIAVNAWTTTGKIEVLENESGSFVAHVSVDDKDLGPSGQVVCGLTDSRFSLQYMYTNTYKIITATTLDREAEDITSVRVHCADRGIPPLSAITDIMVHVLDKNDQMPEFEQTMYTVAVPETSAIGTSVIQVTALDQDVGENARITYHLHANSNNLLRVEPSTGLITTNSLLDHEELDHLTFYILALDNGDPAYTATATVSMEITDINDEFPIFLYQSYHFGTNENQPAGTEIATITAKDLDAAPNDAFVFSLDDNSTFSIHPITGVITSNRMLDREHEDAYYLFVTARNTEPPYLSSTVSLTIIVTDKNDNAPRVTFPKEGNNTVEVSVYSPKSYIVTRVEAQDVDIGKNARLQYSFGKGNKDGLFHIEPFSGAIIVKKDLSQAEKMDYQLLIVVEDEGHPPKSAVATLNVQINKTMTFAKSANIPSNTDEQSYFSLGYHEKILIIIGAITLVVVSLLIVAIICIKYRQGNRGERDSYKYMCRVDMANAAKQAVKAENKGTDKCAVIAGSQDMDKRMVTFNVGSQSHQNAPAPAYPPGMDFPDKAVTMVTSSPVGTPVHTSQTCPLHGNRNASLGTFQRPDQGGHHHGYRTDKLQSQLSTPEKRDAVDSDSTSGCSADMSNSDSGRGYSEEGETGLSRYHGNTKARKDPDNRKVPMPYLPPRTSSLTRPGSKQTSQTGCHGYRTDCHDNNLNKSSPPLSKVPNKDVIRNPGFRNVTVNYNKEKSNSANNLATFSSPPTYVADRPVAVASPGQAINV